MTPNPFRIGFMTPDGLGLVAFETFETLESAMQRACKYLDDSAATEIWIEDGDNHNVADFATINAYRAARPPMPPAPTPTPIAI
jgi:hypothetical protein